MQKKSIDPSKLTIASEDDLIHAQTHVKSFLNLLGNDIKREGLLDTPKRYVKFMNEFLNPPDFVFRVFDNDKGDQMVIVKNIPFYSLCEHHIAPFFGVAHIAYLPSKKIVGLSKLPRVLDMFARRLQNQERIGNQVADFIFNNKDLKAKGVGVVLEARHMCMEMRGVEKSGCSTITSALRGNFMQQKVKEEFFSLIK